MCVLRVCGRERIYIYIYIKRMCCVSLSLASTFDANWTCVNVADSSSPPSLVCFFFCTQLWCQLKLVDWKVEDAASC